MTRPESVLYLAVIARPLIDVIHRQTDGRTRGQTFENPGKDIDLIRLLALGYVARSPRPPPIQIRLDISLGKL